MAASFEARYESTCPSGDEIETGDTVVYDDDDHLWHTTCLKEHQATEARRSRADAVICGVCFVTKPCFC